jgi:hypothetical protein
MASYVIMKAEEVSTGNSYLSDDEAVDLFKKGAGGGLWDAVHCALMEAVEKSAAGRPGAKKGHGWASDGDGFYRYNGELDCNRMAGIIAKCVEGWISNRSEVTKTTLALEALRNQS